LKRLDGLAVPAMVVSNPKWEILVKLVKFLGSGLVCV
jgi:hypothetical protein